MIITKNRFHLLNKYLKQEYKTIVPLDFEMSNNHSGYGTFAPDTIIKLESIQDISFLNKLDKIMLLFSVVADTNYYLSITPTNLYKKVKPLNDCDYIPPELLNDINTNPTITMSRKTKDVKTK